jgi:hypothetical protein
VKSRIGAYAGVQLADYFTGRGLLVLMLTALAVWGYATVNGLTAFAFDASTGVEGRAQLQRAFDVLFAAFALIAAALSAQNLVARHRRRRYDRVIFARALSPLRYYFQGFMVAGLGGALLAVAVAQTYSIVVHPVSVLGATALVGLAWLTIGGLAFLLSALTWLHTPLVAVLVGADLALDRYASALRAAGQGNPLVDAAQYLLPPGHVIVSLSGPFARGLTVDRVALVWPVAFGVVCLAAALLLLRRRPFKS